MRTPCRYRNFSDPRWHVHPTRVISMAEGCSAMQRGGHAGCSATASCPQPHRPLLLTTPERGAQHATAKAPDPCHERASDPDALDARRARYDPPTKCAMSSARARQSGLLGQSIVRVEKSCPVAHSEQDRAGRAVRRFRAARPVDAPRTIPASLRRCARACASRHHPRRRMISVAFGCR